MNKGAKLEEEVFNAVTKLINDGSFPFQASQCKVYSHKKYFSRDRGAFIDTDVSVEIFIGGASDPFFVWIWECKNYGKAIPVDDLEEFHAKLEQIGADNTKGTMITSDGHFQTGSIHYARSKKIGLARLLPNEQVEFLMYLITPDMMESIISGNNYFRALTQRAYRAIMQDTFITDENGQFSSLKAYISETLRTAFKPGR